MATLGLVTNAVDTVPVRFPDGGGFTLPIAFVYAEGHADAGDPVDVSGYTWEVSFLSSEADNTPRFTLAEGDGIDVTDAATGTIELTLSAARAALAVQTFASGRALFGDLLGEAAGRALYPVRLRLEPQPFTTEVGSSHSEDFALTVDLDDDLVPVTISVSTAGLPGPTFGTRTVVASTRDLATSDVAALLVLQADLTLPAGFNPDGNILAYADGADRDVALPGGTLTIPAGQTRLLFWLDADNALVVAMPTAAFSA